MVDRSVEDAIRLKMQARGQDREAVEGFLHMLRRTETNETAFIPLKDLCAPDAGHIYDLTSERERLEEFEAHGRTLLSKVVVIKLNGGRSTTMGGEVPKGVLTAKDGLSYLEIIVRQMKAMCRAWGVEVPLTLMNSFFTDAKTHEVIGKSDIPIVTFLQSEVPRLVEHTLLPIETGTDEDWTPPGHGDVYVSLKRSGLLERFLREGKRWAFISNLDNLAAVLDPWILGLMGQEKIPFLLEVTDRTEMDRKGGTLIVNNGKLDLLEIAQVAPEDQDKFMDIHRFRVFNTNNAWVDLEALAQALVQDSLFLPIIRNRKAVSANSVIQLETAMGAALGSFPRARALRVTRDRFFPTKKVEDLFLLQSDACVLDSSYHVIRNPGRPAHLALRPEVAFGPEFLDSPLRMGDRFEDPASVSLVRAASLKVYGSVFFEKNVKIEGQVEINGPAGEPYTITQGTVLKDGAYP